MVDRLYANLMMIRLVGGKQTFGRCSLVSFHLLSFKNHVVFGREDPFPFHLVSIALRSIGKGWMSLWSFFMGLFLNQGERILGCRILIFQRNLRAPSFFICKVPSLRRIEFSSFFGGLRFLGILSSIGEFYMEKLTLSFFFSFF